MRRLNGKGRGCTRRLRTPREQRANGRPVSVPVIPHGLTEDLGAQHRKDVYENVSGVYQAGNTLNAQTEVLSIIRGFESPLLYRNVMRSSLAGAVDLGNVEHVEVLKGPASILYGTVIGKRRGQDIPAVSSERMQWRASP